MTRTRLLAVAGGCWLMLCSAGAASAEEPTADGVHTASDNDAELAVEGLHTASNQSEEAIEAFVIGKEYFDAGKYELARDQLEKAYALTNDPELLYDLGQTYRLMGECVRAREVYERFLQSAPTSPWAERAHKHLTVLRAACPASSAGAPSAVNEPPQPLPQPPPRRPRGLEAKPGPPRTTPAEPADRGLWRGWSWVALATGAAVTGVAVGLEAWNGQRYATWRERDLDLEKGTGPEETDAAWLARQEDNDRLAGSVESVDRASLVVGVGGVVLVAASAVLFQVAGRKSPDPSRALKLRSGGVRGAHAHSKHESRMHLRLAMSDPSSTSIALVMSY